MSNDKREKYRQGRGKKEKRFRHLFKEWSKQPLKERVISSENRQKEWGTDLRRSIGMVLLSKLNWEVGDEAFVPGKSGYVPKKNLERKTKMRSLGRRRCRTQNPFNVVFKIITEKMEELTLEYIVIQSLDLHMIAAWRESAQIENKPHLLSNPSLANQS